jgi:glutathione synthase/RimK-type ligase-like ATP-grasp enzyme
MSTCGVFVNRQTLSNSNQLDSLLRFRDVAELMHHKVDFIFPTDMQKILNLDALFIRARTDPMNVTYIAARLAELNDIPVIDDSQSIKICSDKINMYSKMKHNNISIPQTVCLSKTELSTQRIDELFSELGTPLILKEPSTSFSMRVEKAETPQQFLKIAKRFIKLSDWIVVQKYVESTYDWLEH